MRITNKIIQNNQLTNINTNKTLQDTLSTQISSGKNIARPSDDPIVALRSLRLRTSVNQTEQYLKKNVEDADSWLQVTEDSIKTLSDIITDIRQQYTKGTSDTLAASDRQIIIENLQSLAAEVYNTGNADFAGRSVFTGFRTSSTLTFQKDENIQYKITETSESLSLGTSKYVSYKAGMDNETEVEQTEIRRIRLSYKNLDDTAPELSFKATDGTVIKPTVTMAHMDANPNPYDQVLADKDAVIYIPETGELLLGEDVADGAELKDIEGLSVDYNKTKWSKGELKPEHYFNCSDLTNKIDYKNDEVHEIEYNIGVNQSLRINTTANECFTHDISRDIDDAITALNELTNVEKTVKDLKTKLAAASDADKPQIQNQIDAAEKALTYIKKNVHDFFSKNITNADGYLDANNLALTNCGTRSKRLELIQNRLDTQLSSLNDLKSENEDVDTAETAIKLASAQYAYDAALMSASKILKENLLNYI